MKQTGTTRNDGAAGWASTAASTVLEAVTRAWKSRGGRHLGEAPAEIIQNYVLVADQQRVIHKRDSLGDLFRRWLNIGERLEPEEKQFLFEKKTHWPPEFVQRHAALRRPYDEWKVDWPLEYPACMSHRLWATQV